MKVVADLCIVPIGVGVSLSAYVAAAHEELCGAKLKCALHSFGTNVEGEYSDVFGALERAIDRVHAMGAPRVTCTIKLGTRTDREPDMMAKVRAVEERLA